MTDFLQNKWIKAFYLAGREIGKILYPPRCLVCNGVLGYEEKIHPECVRQLYPIEEPTCMCCGKPLEAKRDEYCFDCKRAIKNGQKLAFTQGKSLYLYQGGLKQGMYRFKYSNSREYGIFFAEEALRRYGDWILSNEIEAIVPVPMYEKKRKRRGYNQAEVFARELSLLTGIPVEAKMVARIKNTSPQKDLNDVERKNNLKNAFQMRKFGVQYKKILVVDDIYTTGSTINAVTQELKSAGVQWVYALTICIGAGC